MNYVKETQLSDFITQALYEDIGRKDISTESVIPKDKFVKAALVARQDCIVCGVHIAGLVFKTQDRNIKFTARVKDGQSLKKQEVLAEIQGRAQGILTAERVALNFLSLLSGVATRTREYVCAVWPHKARIMDTRKTIPGLRQLQKYAVRAGGGYNHRMSLEEMILIKDNHLAVLKGYHGLPKIPSAFQTEFEAKNLREFKQALKLRPDIIMLDNMSVKDIKKAVRIRNNCLYAVPKLEASGGVTLKNVKKIASSGVDFISIGALTHSVNSVDISLEII